MSFYLLELTFPLQEAPLKQIKWQQPHNIPQGIEIQFNRFDKCLMKHLYSHRQFTNIIFNQNAQSKAYNVLLQNISSCFRGMLSFLYIKRKKTLRVFFHFLNKNNQFMKCQSRHILKQFHRNIFLAKDSKYNLSKLLLNNTNGSVCLEICYFPILNSNIVEDIDKIGHLHAKNLILDIYRNYVAYFIPLFQRAFNVFTPIQQRFQDQQNSEMISNIHRYSKMMTLKSQFGMEAITTETAKVAQMKQRQDTVKKLISRQLPIGDYLAKPTTLYLTLRADMDKRQETNDFQISSSEEENMVSAITLETPAHSEFQGRQRQNILSYIRVNEPNNIRTFPLSVGGFSFIESAEIQFSYVDSFSQEENLELPRKMLQKKYMAIKRQNRPHGKNLHQYKILMELRNGCNPVIPKYFIPLNIPDFKIDTNPLLMMELLQNGNLVQFLRNRNSYLSLTSKLHLIFSITTGLRYLSTYNIVHLDLKPSNIMLTQNLMVKIIDYGEAYHREVCKAEGNNYKPGFTIPYSPPEFLIGLKWGFTSKADVYSLGIIMFEILYGKIPIFQRQKWFLASENCDVYGEPVIMRVLNWIISRSLTRNPEYRPELDWIAIIIRLCIEAII